MGFKSVILVVDDVIKARKLYEDILECEISGDFGESNVGFTGGLALYRRTMFSRISSTQSIPEKANNLAVYFEFKDLSTIRDAVCNAGYEFIHDIETQPWEQRAFRFYDDDKHIIEAAEDMDVVFTRLSNEGRNIKEIAKKTGYAVEAVEVELRKLSIM